jgi:predicted secreted protein
MSLLFGIAVFFVVWWIVLFAVLPFGVHTQSEAGSVVPGTPESAPARFRIWRLLLVNTLVACTVYGLIWVIIVYDVFGIASVEEAARLVR